MCCHCCFGHAGEAVVAELLSVPASRSPLTHSSLLPDSFLVTERAAGAVVALVEAVGFGVSVDVDGVCVGVAEGTIQMRLKERHGQRMQKSRIQREAKE